jgi:GR25 family glycosyltransferase involved in LPS biosynthesis
MRNLILLFAFLATISTNLRASVMPNPIRHIMGETYIEQYRQIAIMESIRTGIPASIKLAQGLLESGYGQGVLAVTSNNHFGIKWRSSVDGDFVEAYDDEKDKNGRRITSRFVKFHTAEESYQQHSVLLMTRPVYRILFTYDRSDYRSWAYGLKKAGYATNPKYAERLIQIIEQYHLDRFDIPTQIDPDEPVSEFSEPKYEKDQQAPSSRPFSSRPASKSKNDTKATQNRVPKPIVKEEEEHILYEVTTSKVTTKSPESTKKAVSKKSE